MKIKRTDVDIMGNNDCSDIYYWMSPYLKTYWIIVLCIQNYQKRWHAVYNVHEVESL